MIHKTRGIVLHHVKYRESSAIIYMYTEKFGRQAYLVNSIKGRRSRFGSNLLQPLTLLEMEVYHKAGRELQRLKEIRNYIPFQNIPFNPVKASQALFLAEVLNKALREEDPTPGLYEYLEHSLQLLDVSGKSTLNFHLLFLVQLTKYLGFYPENDYSKEKIMFDMRNGHFSDSAGIHPDFIDTENSMLLHQLLLLSFSSLSEISINNILRKRFLEYIMEYYQIQIHGFGRLKSLPVLIEIYSNEKNSLTD